MRSRNGKLAAGLGPASLMAIARQVTETPSATRKIVA
jgi:hypothetical protein